MPIGIIQDSRFDRRNAVGIRFCVVLQRKKCRYAFDYVLCRNGRNAVMRLIMSCAATEEMP